MALHGLLEGNKNSMKYRFSKFKFRLISKSETEKYLKWKGEAVTDNTCPVGPDIPWVGSVNGGPKVRNKDFQLVCLGPKDSCCKK